MYTVVYKCSEVVTEVNCVGIHSLVDTIIRISYYAWMEILEVKINKEETIC